MADIDARYFLSSTCWSQTAAQQGLLPRNYPAGIMPIAQLYATSVQPRSTTALTTWELDFVEAVDGHQPGKPAEPVLHATEKCLQART